MDQHREWGSLGAVSKSSVSYVADPMIYDKSCSKICFLLNCKIAKKNFESIEFVYCDAFFLDWFHLQAYFLVTLCGHTSIRHLVHLFALAGENGNENFHWKSDWSQIAFRRQGQKGAWRREVTVGFLNGWITHLCEVEQIKLGHRSAFEIQVQMHLLQRVWKVGLVSSRCEEHSLLLASEWAEEFSQCINSPDQGCQREVIGGKAG